MRARGGAPASNPPAELGVRVLFIDDAPDIRGLYATYLEYVGFRVESAADGRDGLTKAHALRPDIIVLDLSLPQIDGWTLCQTLKGTPLTRGIPVIALSGFADEKSRERAQAAGVDAFLSKPCLPEELIQEIQRRVAAGNPSSAAAPKCSLCSGVIEAQDRVVFEHGDIFHVGCGHNRESESGMQGPHRGTRRAPPPSD